MGAATLVPDSLWQLIEPLLPAPLPNSRGGRPRLSDRTCLTGIVFVLRSGIPWQILPKEIGCGSGMSCWRRLRDWQQAGVWDLIHFALLNWLSRENQVDWSCAVIDSCSVRAGFWGQQTGANCHDSTQALALLDQIPPLQGLRGRPRCRPDAVLGDRAYDAQNIRCSMRARRILPLLAMRNTRHGSGLGRWRWVVERTFAWLNHFAVFACGMKSERIYIPHSCRSRAY